MIEFFLPLIGGILYRLRGGGINSIVGGPIGTQNARMIYAVPTGILCAYLAGVVWWAWILICVAVWLGLLLPHARYMQKTPQPYSMIGMSLTCIVRGGLVAGALYHWDVRAGVVLMITGAFAGPLYWLAWRDWVPGFPTTPITESQNIAWGEFLTGTINWLGLALFMGYLHGF